jgi:hypothetical protein
LVQGLLYWPCIYWRSWRMEVWSFRCDDPLCTGLEDSMDMSHRLLFPWGPGQLVHWLSLSSASQCVTEIWHSGFPLNDMSVFLTVFQYTYYIVVVVRGTGLIFGLVFQISLYNRWLWSRFEPVAVVIFIEPSSHRLPSTTWNTVDILGLWSLYMIM